jgi:predicted ferric reductase
LKRAWVAGCGVAAVLPLGAVLVGSPPAGRGFVIELGSALGIVALSVLGLQLALPARVPALVRALGADVAVRLHRRLADLLVAAIAAHVALVMIAHPANVALLDPLGAPWRAKTAVASTAAVAALVASSLLRRWLRLAYAHWRAVHLALAVGALAFGAAHAVGVGRYLTSGPAGVVAAVLAATGLVAVLELRLLRPRRLAARAYVVERLVPERGGATTVALRADGHRGRRFRAGQFAWLKLADAPYALAEHPFSYASSGQRPGRPEFTIKAYEGFTRQIPQRLRAGTRVLLDGPHGSYRARAHADRFVLIAGGIGITPIISLLRTAADAGDRRPFVLVYGSLRWEQVTFREQLEQLQRRLNLCVVHVLTDPPPGWTGETGLIDDAVLARHLVGDVAAADVFVCGPPPMLAAALTALRRLGLAHKHIHTEQFLTV